MPAIDVGNAIDWAGDWFCRCLVMPALCMAAVNSQGDDKSTILSCLSQWLAACDAPLRDVVSCDALFQLLSIDNIVTIFGCLLVEAKVALVSRHLSLLTPVASGLLSLLFPFDWQGAFIPIMPKVSG